MISRIPQRNLQHDRAKYAHDCIENVLAKEKEKAFEGISEKYKSEVMSTPVRIHDAGLMQTLAFYCSKMKVENGKEKNPHFSMLALHIMKWILNDEAERTGREDALNLFSSLLDQSDEEMILHTQEAIEVTQWLKRFADARIEKESSENEAPAAHQG